MTMTELERVAREMLADALDPYLAQTLIPMLRSGADVGPMQSVVECIKTALTSAPPGERLIPDNLIFLEAWERDANRYRWLRDHSERFASIESPDPETGFTAGMIEPPFLVDDDASGATMLIGKEMDIAIDAAMAKGWEK